MINPTAINGIGPLRNANPLAAAGPQAGNANGNSVAPLGDGGALSPEAQGQDGDLGQMMQALMQAFGMGQDQQQSPEQRIQQLQQEIAQTEQQLGQAQQAGDQEAVQGLTQKLDALKAELAQLTGQGAARKAVERPLAVGAAVKLLLPVAAEGAVKQAAEAEHLRAAEAVEALPVAVRLLAAAGEHLPVVAGEHLPEAETAEGQRPSTEPAVPTEAVRRVPSDRPIKFPPN